MDPHTLHLTMVDHSGERTVTAANVLIAVGTEATRDPKIPFDGQNIFVSDDILTLKKLPRTLAVIGAGVVGCEYASIFSALGVRVTLVDRARRLLPFVDAEVVEALDYHLRQNRMTLRFNEAVSGIELVQNGTDPRVKIHLASGKEIVAEKALYSIGRTGATSKAESGGGGTKSRRKRPPESE